MPYRAILFDLDGTLLNTLEDIADATNAALAELGFAPRPVMDFKRLVGDGVAMLARRVVPPDRADEATRARFAEVFRGKYAANWADKTRPYDGVPEMLDAVAARGLPMAVLSNKPHDFTLRCVERLLPDGRFAAVLGLRPEVPRKPAPDGAREIAAALGVEPEGFLYLGDTNTDMQTAVAAGMDPVGALWGFRTAEELTAHGARMLLAQPGDLPPLLD